MYKRSFLHFVIAGSVSLMFLFSFQTQAQTLKRKAAFNLNWKFYKGTPSGTPSAKDFSDGSWTSISVPHSPSYDSTCWASEQQHYSGDCWYRKTFTVSAAAKKVFIEFEGAMSVATVWVNGAQVGMHDNSGYTPFYFDISGSVVRGAANVIAVKLNNQNNPNIPPGQTIDFNLFGGLYRNVWLRFKDSVYVPINTQQIMTENVSASSATIHALTSVKNDAATAKTCQVTVTLYDAANTSVVTKTLEQAVAGNSLDTFDMKTEPFTNPKLWSPASPYMYSVRTTVKVGGVVVDSVSEPCGVRWFTWSGPQGFYLNGSRLEIRGMCQHQTEGWIGDAVPDSRHYQEVKMLKNLGCNSIRCSHYPRSQAFYDFCDQQGMLLYVEIPSWGYGQTPNAARWARMDSCVREMIMAGRNHPSIYIWGLYNEPLTSGDFTSEITVLNKTAHKFDTTRFTGMANIKSFNDAISVPDVQGLNYSTTGTLAGTARWLNTESRHSFTVASFRGSAIDLDTNPSSSTTGTCADEWGQMSYTLNTSGQLAGGHFWCFKDYNSPSNTGGYEGVVDRLTIPKTDFYFFRQKWTGQAPDYPKGGAATKIEFTTDTSSLYATGSEVFLLSATMRDANNRQIANATGNVTFTVSPQSAGTIFGGNSQPAMAGRIGVLLKTSATPSTITVTAAYSNLPSASLTLTTLPISESYTEGPSSIQASAAKTMVIDGSTLRISSSVKGYTFHCPLENGRLSVMDCMGRTLYEANVTKGELPVVGRSMTGTGLFYGVWKSANRHVVSKCTIVSQ